MSDESFDAGKCIWTGLAVGVLAEALVKRRGRDDLAQAQAVMDRLAAVPTDPGFVLNDLGFKGHIAMAEALPTNQ